MKGDYIISKILLLIILFCFINKTITYADYGKSGWMIFKKIQTTRIKSVSSISPEGNNISGIFYNPAILGLAKQRSIYFVSEIGFVEDKYGGVIFSEPIKSKDSTIASGIVYYNAGEIELNWLENNEIKTQKATAQKDFLWMLSYGHQMKSNIFLGMTLKVAKSEIIQRETAIAYAGDIGFFWNPLKDIFITGAFQNFGTSTKFIEEKNLLPTSGYVGLGYIYRNKINGYYFFSGISSTYNLADEKLEKEVGIEIGYNLLSINVGYDFDIKESNLLLGLVLKVKNMEIGYAFMPGNFLNDTHKFSFGIKM